MTAASDLSAAIRRGLREIADPALAPGQQAYMKSKMPFLGVRVPVVRQTVRTLAKGDQDAEVLQAAALELWRGATHREERYAALAVMALRPVRGRRSTLPVHEEMIRTGAWWDFVDEASHRLRELLDADARVGEEMRAWSRADDMWMRRASIICQLGRRGDTDLDLLSTAITANVDDPEFFIRKAIGWALRDYARHDPDWVRAFVASHPLSPLSRREALKHLG